MAAPLITLSEYRTLAGTDASDTRDDAQVTALLAGASQAIRNYTGRSFEVAAGSPTARTFLYDGSGILDTDDFVALNAITTDYGIVGNTYSFTAEEYTLMPQGMPPYYWIVLHSAVFGLSPEMGFTRNLDQYEFSGREPIITVTASWGWPAIPDDVKLAAAWTIQDVMRTPQGPTSESIEGYARSWGTQGQAFPMLAVPNRARDLLASYQRVFA
jgi:hypothetical protein